MYVLYQLNEKNELTISFHIFFHLTYALLFLKRHLPAIRVVHVLSTSHAVFMKSTSAKSRQESLFSADFKLCDVLECPNEARIGKRDPQ